MKPIYNGDLRITMEKISLKQLQHLPELHRLVCEQLIRQGSWQLTVDSLSPRLEKLDKETLKR